MVIPKINSAHGSDTRNILNRVIDLINVQGKSIQDLVAKGQLTPTQYATLIQAVNGLIAKGEVSPLDINKNLGKFDASYFSDEFLRELNNGEINATNLLTGSVTRVKLADKSITPEKTTMFNNANLFDKNSLTLDKSFDESGNIINDTVRVITDFIPVQPSEQLSITPLSYRIVYYDENLNKVSLRRGTGGGLFEVDSTDSIRFMRLSGFNETMLNGNIMMNRGTTLLPYEDFGMLKRGYIPGIEEGSITLNLLSEDITDKLLPETIIKTNLFDVSRLKLGNITSSGAVVPSGSIMVTDYYIDVHGGNPYTFAVGGLTQAALFSWKVAYYDASGTNIIVQEFLNVPGNTSWTLDAPENAETALVSATTSAVDTFTIVIGNDPYKSSDEGEAYNDEIWDIIGKPKLADESVEERHLSPQLLNKISSGGSVNRKYPQPATMNFEVFSTLAEKPFWMDESGETIYIGRFFDLRQTRDEYETIQSIGQPFDHQVRGVRILNDGQLLVSTGRVQSEGRKATVYKSENYDVNTPENTTFKQVHQATGEAADFYNNWGMDVYKSIVLLGEYGTKAGTGARRVYLSEDDAETFREIFWQETVYAENGIPYDEATAHVHTVKYDPYFQRIWVVCGDGINTGSFYSDDMGDSWKVVEGSTGLGAVQYTGIAVLPDCVVFGSDRSPNGLHIWERTLSKTDTVRIKPWAIINDHQITSHIFQMAFQRSAGEPVYFGSHWDKRAGAGKSVIMSFVNKNSVQVVCEVPEIYDETTENLGAQHVIGKTVNGYVYTAWLDRETNWNIARAQAPEWITV